MDEPIRPTYTILPEYNHYEYYSFINQDDGLEGLSFPQFVHHIRDFFLKKGFNLDCDDSIKIYCRKGNYQEDEHGDIGLCRQITNYSQEELEQNRRENLERLEKYRQELQKYEEEMRLYKKYKKEMHNEEMKTSKLKSLQKRMDEYFYLKDCFAKNPEEMLKNKNKYARLRTLQEYFERNLNGFPK